MCRHPSEGLPRRQDPLCAVRGTDRRPRDEDQVDAEAAEPGRLRLRVPTHAHEARHRNDCHRLHRPWHRQRVHIGVSLAMQI